MPAHIVAATALITAFSMNGGVRANFPAENHAESRNGRTRIRGRAVYKQALRKVLVTRPCPNTNEYGMSDVMLAPNILEYSRIYKGENTYSGLLSLSEKISGLFTTSQYLSNCNLLVPSGDTCILRQ